MATVTATKKIHAPVEKVFATWNDEYGDIYKFSPGLSHSELLETSPAPSGKGALRHCDLVDGKTGFVNASFPLRQTSKS